MKPFVILNYLCINYIIMWGGGQPKSEVSQKLNPQFLRRKNHLHLGSHVLKCVPGSGSKLCLHVEVTNESVNGYLQRGYLFL